MAGVLTDYYATTINNNTGFYFLFSEIISTRNIMMNASIKCVKKDSIVYRDYLMGPIEVMDGYVIW